MSPLRIQYETEGFPAGTLPSGLNELTLEWDDILWAAVTVGRPSRNYAFRHGMASSYEALFRWSLVRMALEQSGPSGHRLRRTEAFKTLDPTEKGAVNYFLGMIFCKVFSTRLLNTPWLLHLDVFRPRLNAVLTGRSRPDLIGREHGTSRWHAFECKGRVSPPDASVKQKAKSQAQRLVSVNRTPCTHHVGTVTFFRNDVLQFFWRDPDPKPESRFDVVFSDDQWRHYYWPVVQYLRENKDLWGIMQEQVGFYRSIEGLDLEISIYPAVAEYLFREEWTSAQGVAVEARREIQEAGYEPDGIVVKAGESWYRPFEE